MADSQPATRRRFRRSTVIALWAWAFGTVWGSGLLLLGPILQQSRWVFIVVPMGAIVFFLMLLRGLAALGRERREGI